MAKRHGAEFWQEHLAAWHQSDLTQRAYCANHGLGEKAFHAWHRKEKEALAAAKAPLTLVPIRLSAPAAGTSNYRQRMHRGWLIF